MTASSQDDLWAKRDAPGRWHSLVGHSADVGAVLAALLDLPTVGERLRRLGRTDAAAASSISAQVSTQVSTQVSALTFLHDVGKANRGFQARSDANAPRVGPIDELAWVFSPRRGTDAVCDRLSERLGLDRVAAWLRHAAAAAAGRGRC